MKKVKEKIEMEQKEKRRRDYKKKSVGVITERDKLACKWVCEQGAMTVDQLWRAVWWNQDSRSAKLAYRRILFLTRSGHLQKIRTKNSRKSYYKATKLGYGLALEKGITPLRAPAEAELMHTDGLTEMRIAVLKSGRFESGTRFWRTDRVLEIDPGFPKERFYGHIPDAIWVTAAGKKIAIEYERTRKSITRVRQKIEAFSREMARVDREFDMVLWVITPGVEVMIGKLLVNHPNQITRSLDGFLKELEQS